MNRQQSSKARERRLRAKYRKNLRIAVVVSLIIGIILGCAVMNYVQKTRPVQSSRPDLSVLTPSPSALALDLTPTSEVTLAPTEQPTEAPTEAPTAVPTPVPTPSPTPAPQAVVVPFGTAQTVQAQIHNDGTVRRDVDAETYETLTFSITVKRYLTPEYYQQQYSTQYQLQGDEAGVEFELMLVDYTGTQTIIPQDLLTIGLETLSGATEQGFQLTDAEIHGDNKVSVVTNVPKEIYKRFKFSQTTGDMDYMSVTGVVDGVATKYLFELGEPVRPTAAPTPSPTPARTYETLEVGSSGDAVKDLQNALIDQGFLTGSADGKYGNATATAVKAAQATFGMEETGIADNALQQNLFPRRRTVYLSRIAQQRKFELTVQLSGVFHSLAERRREELIYGRRVHGRRLARTQEFFTLKPPYLVFHGFGRARLRKIHALKREMRRYAALSAGHRLFRPREVRQQKAPLSFGQHGRGVRVRLRPALELRRRDFRRQGLGVPVSILKAQPPLKLPAHLRVRLGLRQSLLCLLPRRPGLA